MKRLMPAAALLLVAAAADIGAAEMLCDHEVVLDDAGRLLPWASYDHVIAGSMAFIKGCPTVETKHGQDPWFLVTSKLKPDGSFMRNQNQQGFNAYLAVETLVRYYAYSGDAEAVRPVRLLVDRVLSYHTPAGWAWPNVPRTQDNSPDGEYTDATAEPDKMCMVGVAYLKMHRLTGEAKYLEGARGIAAAIAGHVREGDATHSPLPFRVDLERGEVRDAYTANMIHAVMFFDDLAKLGEDGGGRYREKRDAIMRWILAYPMVSNEWQGLYEDVPGHSLNQQTPMETARYLLKHPQLDPEYRKHVPALLAWVKGRFGQKKRCGATSIIEQDCCPYEMSDHTARYASVVARWFGLTGDPADREEARASFALSTYSTFSKYSHDGMAVNYVGVGYVNPWFSDSYFDLLLQYFEGMAELPEMAPADSDHLIASDSVVRKVTYTPGRVEYETSEKQGEELLRLTFRPASVLADGRRLPDSDWSYGAYHGVPGILRVRRTNATHITVAGARTTVAPPTRR